MDLSEHVPDAVTTLREEVLRLLPGGLLVLWTSSGVGLRSVKLALQLRIDLEHVQYFTAGSVSALAQMLSVSVVHSEDIGHYDLNGMSTPARGNSSHAILRAIISATKPISGYRVLEGLRRRRWRDPQGDSPGKYRLFAILKKPGAHGGQSDCGAAP